MIRHEIFDAIEFAVRAHRGQYRKGTKIPYVVHPINMGRILIENGCSDTVVIAGILHDVIEDTDVSIDLIQEQFGEDVANLVMWGSEKDKSDTWENRKRLTLAALESAPMDLLLISLVDKLDNIRSMRAGSQREGEKFWERFNRPKVTQAWYYRGLLDVFLRRIDIEPGKTLLNSFCSEVDTVFGNIDSNPDLA